MIGGFEVADNKTRNLIKQSAARFFEERALARLISGVEI
jgi:hypothetical protein